MKIKSTTDIYYREKIIEMVKEIKTPEFLEKIYHYIKVPYRMEKEKQK